VTLSHGERGHGFSHPAISHDDYPHQHEPKNS
jgi:hypothetical protein